MPRPYQDLPAFYYHDHFSEMISFVMAMYSAALGREEHRFLSDYSSLEKAAQCLLLRITNRKRPVFGRNDLRYPEIEDIDACLDLLKAGGWIRPVDDTDYVALLSTTNKDALYAVAKSQGHDVKSSWSKAKLTAFFQEHLPFREYERLIDCRNLFVPARAAEIDFVLYLYFGKLNEGLTVLALRDLGIANTNARESFSAKFRDLAEARAGFAYSNCIKRLKAAKGEGLSLFSIDKLVDLPPAETAYTEQLRNSFFYLLGGLWEKAKDYAAAMTIYGFSNSFECRERVVRLLFNQNEKDKATRILEDMIASPSSDEEFYFASDFLMRKVGRQKTSIYTDLLRSSTEISIDEFFRGSPEQAAIRHFKKDGWEGAHVENFIWNTLFGLIFWDELFEQKGAMTSAFEWRPHSLITKEFHNVHQDTINDKLSLVREGHASILTKAVYRKHKGTPNGIFAWFEGLWDLVEQFVIHAPAKPFAAVLESMSKDYYAMCDGFPDLLLIKGKDVRFVEIKAEGDQVRRHQLTRFMQLKSCGFDVDICRVKYHVDPGQIYVIIDVETTGGRPPQDRVTEIGAVKVQNGKIIGEWQTLVNPERHIPAMITSLTGISNAIVADAPKFADIAKEFLEFIDGAIFVAHNVNFDYGFIASEVRRLEIPFKLPKLCTCAFMRRYFPGLDSYGLANLCDIYGIELETHHRALCDARAAAQLLIKINQKRMSTVDCLQAA